MGGVHVFGGGNEREVLTFDDPEWTEWKRTFLFLPKETITGNEIIGFAWTRMEVMRIHEYEDAIGYHLSPGKDGTEYARNKKEIFLNNLKGEE